MYIEKLHPAIGAKIEGVDLANLDDSQFDKINELWLKNLILLFPNQCISDENQCV